MRQTIGTYLRNDSIPSSLNEDEIRRRLGIDDLLCTNNKSVENVHSYRSLFLPSLPSTSVIFVLAALVNFATVGMAAPMHKAILMRKSLSDIDLSSLEDTILPDTDRHRFATKYFIDFGHLTTSAPTQRQFRNAIRSFQDMTGLEQTGILDDQTFEQMSQPRCGNSDVSGGRERRKRFVYIARWENKVKDNVLKLKWYIQNFTNDIPRAEIKKTVRQAFHIWSFQTGIKAMNSLKLEFEEAANESESDITILWAEGDHGDSHKFDGPGENGSNILAHTFYPNHLTKSGDIHLDDFENWHINNSRDGASFPHVLVHEIGHSLGLGHSKKQQAIMYPIYRKDSLESMQLDLDDKCAINWSYVQATDLCLYVFLLSEVLPKKVAIEKDAAYSGIPVIDDGNFEFDQRSQADALRDKLKSTPIPVCRSDNNVQTHYEDLLAQRLQFPRELARVYSEVLCRFFDGMQKEYDSPTTNNFHDLFRIRGAHNYFQQDGRFEALEQAEFNTRQFDSEFFQWIMDEFTK